MGKHATRLGSRAWETHKTCPGFCDAPWTTYQNAFGYASGKHTTHLLATRWGEAYHAPSDQTTRKTCHTPVGHAQGNTYHARAFAPHAKESMTHNPWGRAPGKIHTTYYTPSDPAPGNAFRM